MNIYVGNLPHVTTEVELKEASGEFGTVDSVNIITDRDTGRSKGFGFVEMPDDSSAKNALQVMDGKEFGGRTLTVNEARPRKQRSESRF